MDPKETVVIDREKIRQLTMPTIIAGLMIIGPLFRLVSEPDHVVIVLTVGDHASSENEVVLKFSDEDIAACEGYSGVSGRCRKLGRISPCYGTNCDRGCNCECIHDLGYIDKDKFVRYTSCLGNPEIVYTYCCSNHPDSDPRPLVESISTPLRGSGIRKMLDELSSVFIQSVLTPATLTI